MPEEQDPWYVLFPSPRVCVSFRAYFGALNQGWLIAGSYACYYFFSLVSDACGHHTFQFSLGTSSLFGYTLEIVVLKQKKKRKAKRSKKKEFREIEGKKECCDCLKIKQQ